ncbi:MAG: DNA topoisomerase III [Clostridiales bacterium]|nr:DNA topoisomerase III [Clostridiales bacterium]
MKSLIIAEKPSVGRDIAKVIGCTGKGEGFLFNENYIVSWAFGHLVTLYDPEDYDESLKRWKRETLPIIPQEIKLKAVKDGKKQLNVLKKLMNDKEVDRLICATDAGREGELIFRYIYAFLKCKKPFSRLWISSMTDKAIKDGFSALKDGSEYNNLYLSAKCRSEADWLVGINASRAFTLKYNVLLSIGRVQTPTLAIICQRQKEIDAFVPQDYYEVTADFGTYSGLYINNNETKIKTIDEANQIIKETQGKEGFVKSVKNEEKKQAPPLLYDLTELQRDANSKFGFTAQKTLSLAQALYEKRKMITYPRTDSRHLSDDMIPKITATLKQLSMTENYGDASSYVLSLPKLPVNKRIIDNSKVTDHHAIIPTDGSLRPHLLSPDEFKVFDLVARRFMQVFYPSYVYSTTSIITEVNSHAFITKGTTVINPGWTALNVTGTKKEKKEDILPNVKEGDPETAQKVTKKKKQTKPPSPYTEAALLSAMENAGRFVEDEVLKEQLKENGLGTPATRAGIIERLITVKYITRKGKSLIPTEKGMKLIEVCPKELKSPETTGRWEKGLVSVSKGKMTPDRFMESIKRYVCFLAENPFKTDTGVVFAPETPKGRRSKLKSLGVCPLCGSPVFENSKAFYCSGWKSGCKFTVWKDELKAYGGEVTPNLISTLLTQGKAENIAVTLPQTAEKCTCDIIINRNIKGFLELKGLKRVQTPPSAPE